MLSAVLLIFNYEQKNPLKINIILQKGVYICSSKGIYYNIKIYYNDKVIKDTAFLDTGNNLKDPYFHKPIILVNSSLIQEHIKTFLVPYYTVNNKDLLEVFSPQKILVNNKKTKKALIGLSDVNINGIKIILNKEILWES